MFASAAPRCMLRHTKREKSWPRLPALHRTMLGQTLLYNGPDVFPAAPAAVSKPAAARRTDPPAN
ncbi:protein of unknown function [Cupriavidus neocaledonicus]|uniref:Uncharacterized protein n=1 Tax=Cupriavidus neocaledonicus TaxID=1040979 RepID=A0A375H182_9BURK|nr:hypothetical protein CBM2605_A60101 [Cupriavidus neocaledonicus]SPD45432.1 protein of unknown function [Cupriavidus neocaledonicus]